MPMNQEEFWKNFNLGEELSISGTFIYNGLRRFHEMQVLDNADELFEFLYNLSVGLERLLKIAVVFLEHEGVVDQAVFEKSLITHMHQDLLRRVRQRHELGTSSVHNEFLALLGTFYKSIRYGRFTLAAVHDRDRERRALYAFLNKYLNLDLGKEDSIFATRNEARYKKFIHRTVTKIANELFRVVREKAGGLNLYTDELRDGSKAATVFRENADLPREDVLWKELLVFFMNTKSTSGCLEFLRNIDPLDFDPELAIEYLQCFRSDAAKAAVTGELEELYNDVPNPGERLDLMDLVANPNATFDFDDDMDGDE